jgi:hypothetical protein
VVVLHADDVSEHLRNYAWGLGEDYVARAELLQNAITEVKLLGFDSELLWLDELWGD